MVLKMQDFLVELQIRFIDKFIQTAFFQFSRNLFKYSCGQSNLGAVP
jgi:hypothetical protein